MKNIIVLLIVIILCPTLLSSQDCPLSYTCPIPSAQPGSVEERWEKGMLGQMKIIEKNFGTLFIATWLPRISFAKNNSKEAWYDQVRHAFTITEWYRTLVIPHGDTVSKESQFAARLMRHELGHALAEQVNYKTQCRPWPDSTIWKYGTKRDRLVQKILSEGIGEYFGNLLTAHTGTSIEWLPTTKKQCVEEPSYWMYQGGYWLVKPILDRFKEKGLKYIMSHTSFIGTGYNLQKMAKQYQQQALIELSQ